MKNNRYIIDANVLIYDPDCIYAYPDAEVIIPISVIEQIDHFKKDISETGRNVRILTQMLDKIRMNGSLTKGIKQDNGSILKIFIMGDKKVNLPIFTNQDKSSNRVLAATITISEEKPESTFLVTSGLFICSESI